jgi:hypothetical protein
MMLKTKVNLHLNADVRSGNELVVKLEITIAS